MQEFDGPGYSLVIEERDDYLYASASGPEDSVDVSIAYWKKVIEECNARGVSKVLVEEDFPNQVTTIEMYTFMTEISKLLTWQLIVAFVDREADHEDLNLFAETVATNRGAFGRVFSNIESAEEWLKGF